MATAEPEETAAAAAEVLALADDPERCIAAAGRLIGRLPVRARFAEHLRHRYADPALPYHGAAHVGLLWLRYLAHGGDAGDAGFALAIAFHDAVYRPGRHGNESRSAALLRAAVEPGAGVGWAVDWAAGAILATADHLGYRGGDPRVQRLLDLDLSPLAERMPVFLRNTAALRREAGAVSDREWAVSRRRLLLGFLARRPLFRSGLGEFYEADAVRNISGFLAVEVGA